MVVFFDQVGNTSSTTGSAGITDHNGLGEFTVTLKSSIESPPLSMVKVRLSISPGARTTCI